jgi:hypothetical protein
MALRLKPACAVVWNLNGVKNGQGTGLKLSTAASDAEKINEPDNLPTL